MVILCALILSYRYNVNGLTTSSSSIVVYGVPQCRELVLLTSKLAAKAGIQTSFICAPDAEEGSRYLMYGNKNNEDENNNIHNENVAEPISKGDVIEKALQEANSLVLIAYDTLIESKTVKHLWVRLRQKACTRLFCYLKWVLLKMLMVVVAVSLEVAVI